MVEISCSKSSGHVSLMSRGRASMLLRSHWLSCSCTGMASSTGRLNKEAINVHPYMDVNEFSQTFVLVF